jgi:hypothetical protein
MENFIEEQKLTQKEKNKLYYANNKDKFKTITKCSICPGKYAYSRKSQHYNTRLHKFHEMKKSIEIRENDNYFINEIQNILNEFKSKRV